MEFESGDLVPTGNLERREGAKIAGPPAYVEAMVEKRKLR